MGNSPSKNASPNTHNVNEPDLSSAATATGGSSEQTEPPDRKSSSSKHIINISNSKNYNNSSYMLNYNKNKLQKKITSKSPKKFTYFNELNNSSDDTLNESISPFDLEINLSMAKTLNDSTTAVAATPMAVNSSTSPTTTNSSAVDEISSSFSDLFTIHSSASSSSSTSPPHFNNLPPIIEEPKKTICTKKPRLGPNEVDIDSIIEKLLMSSVPGSSSPGSHSTKRPSFGTSHKSNHRDFFLKPQEVSIICSKAREQFLSQPPLVRLEAPVKVVGDIHGQFNDLLRILKLSGFPPHSKYLFLGDYVDRGKQSLETILLLLCFKIKYPNHVYMLRGNHESANITKIYGFYDECKRRLNVKCWKMFIDVFNTLPIAGIISDRIFCIHGGLSPALTNLSQIESILRPTDIPEVGLLADLVWSDPDPTVNEWSESDRGVSYCFGKKVVENFCKKFKFDLIIRGHMVVEDGYEFFAKKKLVTVFSAPNYCGEFNNWGAVMSVDRGLLCSFELLRPTKRVT